MVHVGEVFVQGRSRRAAQALLEAAEKIGESSRSVRTTHNGYLVPEAVFEASRLAPKAAPEPEGDDLADLTKAQLVEAAQNLGLPTSGNKANLVERLEAHNQTPEDTVSEGSSEHDEKE